MKQKYTLILLKDGRNILVSDEPINHKDRVFNLKTNDWFVRNVNDKIECNNTYFKIIAGIEPLPTLTYSDEVKQILRDKYGWIDIKELAEIITDSEWTLDSSLDYTGHYKGFINGFQAHQSITNKMFSLEDVFSYSQMICEKLPKLKKLQTSQADDYGNNLDVILKIQDEFIQSLQQPIQLNVEVEMKRETLYTDDGLDYKGEFTHKITNNSILITKILN